MYTEKKGSSENEPGLLTLRQSGTQERGMSAASGKKGGMRRKIHRGEGDADRGKEAGAQNKRARMRKRLSTFFGGQNVGSQARGRNGEDQKEKESDRGLESTVWKRAGLKGRRR